MLTTAFELAETIGQRLLKKQATLAVAESCTGGLIAHLITSIAGCSDYFLLSAVTYSNIAKEHILNVSKDSLERYGAVSEAVVKEMAQGARLSVDADFAISTSGIAGPSFATPDKPVGLVWVGFASKEQSLAKSFYFPEGDRALRKMLFANAALSFLLDNLS